MRDKDVPIDATSWPNARRAFPLGSSHGRLLIGVIANPLDALRSGFEPMHVLPVRPLPHLASHGAENSYYGCW